MAKYKMFSVFDSKVEGFMQPIFLRSTGEAIRSFQEACNDGKSMMSKFPADYALFELGEFDDDGAKFNLLPTPKSVILAVQCKQSAEATPLFPGRPQQPASGQA